MQAVEVTQSLTCCTQEGRNFNCCSSQPSVQQQHSSSQVLFLSADVAACLNPKYVSQLYQKEGQLSCSFGSLSNKQYVFAPRCSEYALIDIRASSGKDLCGIAYRPLVDTRYRLSRRIVIFRACIASKLCRHSSPVAVTKIQSGRGEMSQPLTLYRKQTMGAIKPYI